MSLSIVGYNVDSPNEVEFIIYNPIKGFRRYTISHEGIGPKIRKAISEYMKGSHLQNAFCFMTPEERDVIQTGFLPGEY